MVAPVILVGLHADKEPHGTGRREEGLPGVADEEVDGPLGVVEMAAKIIIGAGEAGRENQDHGQKDIADAPERRLHTRPRQSTRTRLYP